MWGGAELIVTRRDEGQSCWDTSTNPNPSNTPVIHAVRVQGGIIRSTCETVAGVQKWHWHPDTEFNPDVRPLEGIDIHILIRFAGISSLCPKPIGPA